MKKKIRSSIALGILGGLILGIGAFYQFSASADEVIPYTQPFFQTSWISLIIGMILILFSLVIFSMAINSSKI